MHYTVLYLYHSARLPPTVIQETRTGVTNPGIWVRVIIITLSRGCLVTYLGHSVGDPEENPGVGARHLGVREVEAPGDRELVE